jgi:hypothetical protein
LVLVLGAFGAGTGNALAEPLLVADASDEASMDVAAVPTWSSLAVSSSKSSISHLAGTVRVSVAPGDHASFSRTADFSPAPSALICRFNLAFSGVGTHEAGTQVLRIGTGFSASNADEADVDTYARLGVNTLGGGTEFRLRDMVTRKNSEAFRGTQAVTWVLNHSGSTLSYAAPDGGTESIGNDHVDVWVGRTKVFDESPVTNATAAIANLKWYSASGSGVTSFDRFIVDTVDATAARDGDLPTPAADLTPTALPAAASEDASIALYRPTPNPFTTNTRFAYAIPTRGAVDIGVFDLAGRRVRTLAQGVQAAGQYQAVWDGFTDNGQRVRQGMYYLRAAIGSDRHVARLVYKGQ